MLKDKKIRLTNIIWLIVWNRVSDKSARYAVFGNSIGSKIYLHYLNIKAVLFGKVVGVGGIRSSHIWVARVMTAFEHIAGGEMKELIRKAMKLIFKYRRALSGQPQTVLEHSGYHKMQD